MSGSLLTFELADWSAADALDAAAISALEAGGVLYFPRLGFPLSPHEQQRLLDPALLAPRVRNISLDGHGALKGVAGGGEAEQTAAAMLGRYRAQARQLIERLLPHYASALRLAPTSFRPREVQTRRQSWRADDRRLHVDAFPTRPNHGERILRVFCNVNPRQAPRVWRIGGPFEDVARRFLPRLKPYSARQARWLHRLRVTKSLRGEYDHLMLQLHDAMKSDLGWQRDSPQRTVPFAAGSTWICFSDQTAHAVMSGQYLLEQTLHLQPAQQYEPDASPLAVLRRLTGRTLG